MLTDKQKRAVFDQFGEEGLKAGGGEPPAGARGGSGGAAGAGGFGARGFGPGADPHVIFSSFFGTSNPFAAFGSQDDMMGGMGGMGGPMGGMHMHMGGAGGPAGGGRQKAEPVRRELACSLEDLFTGTTKKVKITRQRLSHDGKSSRAEEKILEIPIRAGWKKGTTVTFQAEGDEAPGVTPADIQFVVAEKEHARFSRDGDNLIHVVRLPLADALCGSALSVQTLDGRTLSIAVPEVVSPGYSKTVPGEGMPLSKEPGKRGNLVLRFNIVFPHFVSDAKKLQLRTLLS